MGTGSDFDLSESIGVVLTGVVLAGLVVAGLFSVALVAQPADGEVGQSAFQSSDSNVVQSNESNVSADVDARIDASGESPTKSIEPGDEITVVATQGRFIDGESPELVAFDAAGELVYYEDEYDVYYDVDPVPGETYTVEYVGVEHLVGEECPDFLSSDYYSDDQYASSVDWDTWERYVTAEKNDYEPVRGKDACTRDVVERVNLSTGKVTSQYEVVIPDLFSGRTHDVDRVNETHLAVADIFLDRVYVVDARTDEIEWQWQVQDDFQPNATGGPYTQDWTHVNDVEVLPDDRLMASLRNHDQVVFLDRTDSSESALLENWTLGEDNNYSILNEQHNPDYIPEENGGPSVVVGDSHNNRPVEYQRTSNETWERTWNWTDPRVEWPRDADRLPDGNTLVVDTRGGRVLEISPDGEVVWGVEIGVPYDAERLATGDESTGGPAANLTEANGP
ncbi:arylsulfotransferase (asst) [Halobacteriales archaeon SW_6_65_15]|nr:MAG: arylsulfotransferase (asst) [Halobacteriales archaeon SW_6_65_15]